MKNGRQNLYYNFLDDVYVVHLRSILRLNDMAREKKLAKLSYHRNPQHFREIERKIYYKHRADILIPENAGHNLRF